MIPAMDLPEQDPSRTGWGGTVGASAAPPPPGDKDTGRPDDTARPQGAAPEDDQTRRPDDTAPEGGDTASPDDGVPLMAWLRAGAGTSARASDTAEADTIAEPAGTAGPASAGGPATTADGAGFVPGPTVAAEPVTTAKVISVSDPAEAEPAAAAEPVFAAGPDAGTDLATDDEAGWPDDPDALGEPGAPAEGDALVAADAPAGADAAVPTGTLAELSRAVIINAANGDDRGDQWGEILTMFVDDPRGSVLEAAALVDEAIDAFIATVRERQESLASSWEAGGAGTEELRLALQGYRSFWSSLADLRQSA